MKKKIRFRCYIKDDKHKPSKMHVVNLGDAVSEYDCRVMLEHPLMQYVGLKDKNGKEIYEGDIIRHTNEEACHTPYEVPEMTPSNWECLLGIGDGEWDEGGDQYSNIEIIGNIHENPNLLK